MSQFPGAMNQPYYEQPIETTRTSGLAVASLVCGILFCCPFITSLLAVILGGAAFVSIGRDPAKRGRGLAVAGLILGALGLVGWTVAAVMLGGKFAEAYRFVENGPNEAMSKGFSGDVAGFKAMCWGNAGNATDEEARAFFAELQSRYGSFTSCRLNEQGMQNRGFSTDPIVSFPYKLVCANATVDIEVKIAFSDPQQGGFLIKIAELTVVDPDRGDISYPKAGASGGRSRTRSGAATAPGAPPTDSPATAPSNGSGG